ncbi:neurturin-like [Megalops cyprinoides]|uniref:neurturin-like n=1 Tax=Megalops cyprinoides TaxID=118141 RepID=UPI0018643AC0|nr:neurturin-like [Megalops cyprinoides]
MKLWKWAATFALMLCGAALSGLFSKTMLPPGPPKQRGPWPSSPRPSSSPSSSTSSSSHSRPPLSASLSRTGGRRREARSADGFTSLLSEFNQLFQSFTEGELKQVIETLVDRKARRDKAKRTKRARKGLKPCSLREVEVSVTELGLGYESDETILFRYCSGKCVQSRRSYDITLKHMKEAGLLREKRDRARHVPCCRPTLYEEDLSFLDNNDKYYTIHEVSAQECGCI